MYGKECIDVIIQMTSIHWQGELAIAGQWPSRYPVSSGRVLCREALVGSGHDHCVVIAGTYIEFRQSRAVEHVRKLSGRTDYAYCKATEFSERLQGLHGRRRAVRDG